MTESLSIRQALRSAVKRFQHHEQAVLDAEVLLTHVLEKPRSHLHAWPEAILDEDQQARFMRLVQQRAEGVPVAYLTGHREFWSLDFRVTPDTLIPRPETELLVETTLQLIPGGQRLRVADLGTGSGAIAIALAHERPAWQLYACDRSPAALAVATANAKRLGIHNICFLNSSWSEAFAADSLDAIVSNPPYVPERDPHLERGDVRFEPTTALAAGPAGLDDLRQLIATVPRVLKAGGLLLMEHAPEQTREIHSLLNKNNFTDIAGKQDLAGMERISMARKQGS